MSAFSPNEWQHPPEDRQLQEAELNRQAEVARELAEGKSSEPSLIRRALKRFRLGR
jgi:hypothetical protein